ncbi:MAG: hypothetical protein K2X27_25980 [Candidatus Obscuribacterales bacterium]|nr:hypothetical protein [Candidatus Obscuribacterales bacterium]
MDRDAELSKDSKTEKDESLSCRLVKDFFDQNFDKLNQNHDKFVSKTELKSSLTQNTLQGKDARIAESVLSNFHEFELLSNDEWGTENNGISKADAKQFDNAVIKNPFKGLPAKMDLSLKTDEHNPSKFMDILNIYKDKIDDDKSGTLSKLELDHYALTSKDGNAAKGVAKLLSSHFDEINELGSKNSYGGLLKGDSNKKAIGNEELNCLKDLMGSESDFRKKVWQIHDSNLSAGTELGKQGRTISGKGDSAAAVVIGTALEIAGSIESNDSSSIEALLQDYQQRKEMLSSWKFFK